MRAPRSCLGPRGRPRAATTPTEPVRMRAPRPCGRPRPRALRGVAARAGPGPAGRPPRPGVAAGRGRKRLVLSLDGGGLKALFTLGVLEVLEEVLGEVGADHGCADLKLAEAFDLMAGTSAGAIAATLFAMEGAGLAGGGVPFDGTAGRAAAIVKEEAKRIFPFAPLRRGPFQLFRAKYPSRGVEGALQAVLGADTWPALAAAPTPFRTASLLVCSYDLVYQRPIAFVADRDAGEANLLRLDPLAAPFNRGSWRLEELERRLRAAGTWPFWGTDRMSLFNLGGAAAVGDHTVASGATPTAFGPVRKEVWTMTRRFKLWQGVRCASAANTYFPPALVEGFYERVPGAPGDRTAPAVEDLVTCDAGIVANNPALVAVNYLALRDVYGRAQRLAAERTAAANGRPLSDAEALRLERDVGALAAQELDPAGFAVLSIGTGAVSKTAGPGTWKTVASPLDWISGKFGQVASVLDLIMDASPEIAAANLTDLFRAGGVPDQYLRVQVAAQATPGETPDRAGYAPAEVLSLLATLDDTREGSMDELHRIGREVGEVYRPLLERWVRSNVFDGAAGAGVSPANGAATAAASR